MPITQTTPAQAIAEYLAARLERLAKAQIRTLHYIGERSVVAARDSKGYKDWTGNLRSSVGYVISVNGKLVNNSDFGVIIKGSEGAKAGYNYALDLIKQYPVGYCLIVVAGMNYAAYVSAKGKDVLDSALLTSQKLEYLFNAMIY